MDKGLFIITELVTLSIKEKSLTGYGIHNIEVNIPARLNISFLFIIYTI